MASGSGSGITSILVLTVLMTCVGSSFLIGYNLAILNLPAEHIKKFLGDTMLGGAKEKGGIDTAFLYAQVSTTFVIAGAIGAFSCGWLADMVGRRNGLLINHLFAILGGVICAPCVRMGQPALLFVGRFIIGINCGITIGIASLYLTEIAPRRLRGAIGACNQLAITIGICLAYVVTLRSTLNTANFWPIACGLGAVPALISLLILPICPESPRFLFLKKNNEEAARANFKKLSGDDDVDTFISELREEMEVASAQPEFKFSQLFTQKDLRMAVLIACLIQVLQQLSGINAVISYSSIMLAGAGIPEKYSEYCVLAIGVLNVIVTIVSLPLLERAGRRTLLLWPTVVLAFSLLCLTITVTLAQSSPKLQQTMGIVSTILILLYICGFAMGLGPVPALIVSEIFRQGPRAAAYSLSQSIQWLSNLLVLFSYPSLEAKIKGYSFLPFLVIVVVCWVFFFLFMPETKNRTFDEVARDLAVGQVVIGKSQGTAQDAEAAPARKGGQNTSNSGMEDSKEPLLKKQIQSPKMFTTQYE